MPSDEINDMDVYRHVIKVHGGASFMSCPYCRVHIYEERKGQIPTPKVAS
jgi:hypothetical protein